MPTGANRLRRYPGFHVAFRSRHRSQIAMRTPLGGFRVGRDDRRRGAAGSRVFKTGRQSTGEIGLGAPDEDLILTRILWLEGAEAAQRQYP